MTQYQRRILANRSKNVNKLTSLCAYFLYKTEMAYGFGNHILKRLLNNQDKSIIRCHCLFAHQEEAEILAVLKMTTSSLVTEFILLNTLVRKINYKGQKWQKAKNWASEGLVCESNGTSACVKN